MLHKTAEILAKFRDLNRQFFYDEARDFVPSDSFGNREGSYYGEFDEVQEIYQVMYSLYLQLDQQIFFGNYGNAYSNPIEPITIIQDLNNYLTDHIDRLRQLNEKYQDQLRPIKSTLDHYLKTKMTIEYVLGLTEIKDEIGDPEKELLKNEIIDIKVKQAFRKKQLKVVGQFTFYLLCLFVPIILIIVLWTDHRNGKWFQLSLVLIPFGSFLYDRSAFLEIFKFMLTEKFRRNCKEKIKKDLSQNYA